MKPTTLILAVVILFLASCAKDKIYEAGNGNSDHYTSLQDFYNQNEVKSQFYSINGVTGGSFSTPQGTLVTIPPYGFINMMGDTVTGIVIIEFKDLYKKSDMLLSDKHTVENFYGSPIKSGGEFYIRASVNNQSVFINFFGNKVIKVAQPAAVADIDPAMIAFMGAGPMGGPFNGPFAWRADSVPGSVDTTLSGYVFSLYQFSPLQTDSGTWCNSDNQTYFSSFTQAIVTMHQTNTDNYNTDVFLVFKTIKCMVHVYKNFSSGNYPYDYAPEGLECTVVTIGEKDGRIYSSFIPITIANNLTVNFTMNETSTSDFKAALEALN